MSPVAVPEFVNSEQFLKNWQNPLGGAFKRLSHTYDSIISVENLLEAWQEFIKGKRGKKDVQEFQLNLMGHVFSLHNDLKNRAYRQGPYDAFNITDPKPRNIHKASVRDRLLHHAIHRILYPYFDKKFISDSYSCRLDKGVYKALERFERFGKRVSKNNTKQCWILKCDIRQFFASIDHNSLLYIVMKYIPDQNIIWLLTQIIKSFETSSGKGLPLGNLTSQLLVNIYMNEFDQFIKHKLKAKHYIRYADDFVLLSPDKAVLCQSDLHMIRNFLENKLKLSLHPNKVFIKTLSSGVDFLGWVHFSHHKVLRTVTRRRMIKNLLNHNVNKFLSVRASYVGMLKWGNAYKLRRQIIDL